MERTRIEELDERLSAEVIKAEIAAAESKQTANEASHGMATSYSVAGDVEHAKNSALLSLERLSALKKLKKEVDEALNNKAPEIVEPVCFIEISFSDGKKSEFYFVNNSAYISGLDFISPDSILGKAIIGNSIGDSFSYSVGEQRFSGVITAIF